jgi:hypothetical protein
MSRRRNSVSIVQQLRVSLRFVVDRRDGKDGTGLYFVSMRRRLSGELRERSLLTQLSCNFYNLQLPHGASS